MNERKQAPIETRKMPEIYHSKRTNADAEIAPLEQSSIDLSELSRNEAAVKKDIFKSGSNPFISGKSVERPDFPECDACGYGGTGISRCSRCESAFYCGKECQKIAWKKGHKLACSTMKEDCERTGKEIVTLLNGSDPSFLKVSRLEELDGEGAYASAVKNGLYCTIRNLLLEEPKEIKLAYRTNKFYVSFTQYFSCTLFRGERVSRFGFTTFSKVDSARVSGYVSSSEDAFTIWIDSAIAMIETVKDRTIARKEISHRNVHKSTRDVWAAFGMVFAQQRMSRAVLFGPTAAAQGKCSDVSAAVVDRVTSFGSQMRHVLTLVCDFGEEQDPNLVIAANVNQVAAMISHRCDEFGISVDFDSLLKLGSIQLQMYQLVAKPMALEGIKKGAMRQKVCLDRAK